MRYRAFASSKKRSAKAAPKATKTPSSANGKSVRDTRPVIKDSSSSLTIDELEQGVADWLFEGKFRGFSSHTLITRRSFVKNLLWFLKERGDSTCGVRELKEFFVYLAQDHPEGRWGNPRLTRTLRPESVKDYFRALRCMFNWMEREEIVEQSPMSRIPPPKALTSQIQPLTAEQVESLLNAAKNSAMPKRDYAVVALLVDSGLRASECCNLRVGDVDLRANRVHVVKGKGGKQRTVFVGRKTVRAVKSYLSSFKRTGDDYLFTSEGGNTKGEKLTPSGLRQIIKRLGREAGIKGVRVSPHSLRHTYSCFFLREGGNVFTLQANLGHSDLSMTSRYVMVVEADQEEQSRMYSPLDRLRNA